MLQPAIYIGAGSYYLSGSEASGSGGGRISFGRRYRLLISTGVAGQVSKRSCDYYSSISNVVNDTTTTTTTYRGCRSDSSYYIALTTGFEFLDFDGIIGHIDLGYLWPLKSGFQNNFTGNIGAGYKFW